MMDKEKLIKLNNVRQIIVSITHNNYKQYNLNKIVSNIKELKEIMRILGYRVFDKEKIGDTVFDYFIKKKTTDIICCYNDKNIIMYSV